MKKRIVLATPHDRYNYIIDQLTIKFPNIQILRIRNDNELNPEKLLEIDPDYIFFPHWPWKISEHIYEKYNCIIFHMTDLPFGRGGTPLQNLIVRKHDKTKLTAIKCIKELDAGPIFLKRELLLLGTAEEILIRASHLMAEMIEEIILSNPIPTAQFGNGTFFYRRLSEDGNLASLSDISDIYDYIRMLDADGYPNAYLDMGPFRIEFSRATLRVDELIADVKIKRR